ncbi:hypothetical protein ACPXCP_31070 [Streptomyces sp. DT20]|uniref:hypothetical protein n=1 Tax=Streptomyces sp. DT20 TaxID=3416519 RepID=UPI003CEBA3D3
MNAPTFDRAAAARRLGPAGVEAIRRTVATAPPLRPEQREQLRALFASVHVAERGRPAQAA